MICSGVDTAFPQRASTQSSSFLIFHQADQEDNHRHNITMSSSSPTATVDKHTALYHFESIISLFEEESKSTDISPPSPEEDPLEYFGIHDSLSLEQYARLKLVRDDGDQLDTQQEVGTTTTPSPSTSLRRRGVRRGQQDSAEALPTTLTVMTKTHDGCSQERDTHPASS